LPELAPLDAWDKVAVALPPDSGSIVFIPDISPPLPNKLKADGWFELGKLEFCGLLFAVPTAGFAIFGKGNNLLLATRLEAEDGSGIPGSRALISSNKPWLFTNDEFNNFCLEEVEPFN
jgi:hypothetical protein